MSSYEYPRGFPWLSSQDWSKVQEADKLVDKAFKACRLAFQHGGHFVLEHPEQLGKTLHQVPASIWNLQECVDLLGQKRGPHVCVLPMSLRGPFLQTYFFFLHLPNGQYGPVSQLSRSEKCCTGPFNWGEAHCAGEKVKRKIGLFQRKSL